MLVNRVSEVMGRRRMNVSELARRARISRPTAHRLYHDTENLNVSLDVLEKVCEALDADLCELFERVPDAEASATRDREPAGAGV